MFRKGVKSSSSAYASTDKLKQIVRLAQLIFIITYEATCFDLICRSSSGLHTIGYSDAFGDPIV